MNENLCIAIITTASIFAGFLVAFLSSYLTACFRQQAAYIGKAGDYDISRHGGSAQSGGGQGYGSIGRLGASP